MTNPTKPDVVLPSAVPTSLVVEDLVEGDGDEAANGALVDVHYVGVALSTGAEFDSSYDRGDPLTFRLGAGQVISGWDRGVRGMRVGGRRQLTIPPAHGLRRPRHRRRDQAGRDPRVRLRSRGRPLKPVHSTDEPSHDRGSLLAGAPATRPHRVEEA